MNADKVTVYDKYIHMFIEIHTNLIGSVLETDFFDPPSDPPYIKNVQKFSPKQKYFLMLVIFLRCCDVMETQCRGLEARRGVIASLNTQNFYYDIARPTT